MLFFFQEEGWEKLSYLTKAFLSLLCPIICVCFLFKLLLIPEVVGSTLKISLDLFPSMNHWNSISSRFKFKKKKKNWVEIFPIIEKWLSWRRVFSTVFLFIYASVFPAVQLKECLLLPRLLIVLALPLQTEPAFLGGVQVEALSMVSS